MATGDQRDGDCALDYVDHTVSTQGQPISPNYGLPFHDRLGTFRFGAFKASEYVSDLVYNGRRQPTEAQIRNARAAYERQKSTETGV